MTKVLPVVSSLGFSSFLMSSVPSSLGDVTPNWPPVISPFPSPVTVMHHLPFLSLVVIQSTSSSIYSSSYYISPSKLRPLPVLSFSES